jgi:hypothetical protein
LSSERFGRHHRQQVGNAARDGNGESICAGLTDAAMKFTSVDEESIEDDKCQHDRERDDQQDVGESHPAMIRMSTLMQAREEAVRLSAKGLTVYLYRLKDGGYWLTTARPNEVHNLEFIEAVKPVN